MRLAHCLLSLVLAILSLEAAALGLYGVLRETDGSTSDSLLDIDPATGAGQVVGQLPTRNWNDLAGRPGVGSHVYGVSRIPGPEFVNTISRIDTQTAAVDDLYSYTAEDFGFAPSYVLEFTGISFASGDPSQALVLGAFLDFNAGLSERALFWLDLDTGSTSRLVTLSTSVSHLTHASDGTILARDPPGALATVDPVTGTVEVVGTHFGIDVFSLAFHPTTDELFATGFVSSGSDSLVVLSSENASLLEVRGPLGVPGRVNALAFVPEPGTGALVLLGLVALAARRRR